LRQHGGILGLERRGRLDVDQRCIDVAEFGVSGRAVRQQDRPHRVGQPGKVERPVAGIDQAGPRKTVVEREVEDRPSRMDAEGAVGWPRIVSQPAQVGLDGADEIAVRRQALEVRAQRQQRLERFGPAPGIAQPGCVPEDLVGAAFRCAGLTRRRRDGQGRHCECQGQSRDQHPSPIDRAAVADCDIFLSERREWNANSLASGDQMRKCVPASRTRDRSCGLPGPRISKNWGVIPGESTILGS